jgi:hypothetical protein
MSVRVSLRFRDLDVPEEELRSLYGWLLSDPLARRHARPVLAGGKALPGGAQGDVIDLISLILGSGFNAASLALSLVSWRATRPQDPLITIELPDGRSITISQTSPGQARALLESLVDDAGGHGEYSS